MTMEQNILPECRPTISNPDAFRFFLLVVETMRAHRKLAAGAKNEKLVARCDEALIKYLNTTLERMRVLGFDEVPEEIA